MDADPIIIPEAPDPALLAEAARRLTQALAGDTCPWCGAAIAERKQEGRCVYAEPCGCRLYQSGAPAAD
jgi:hypothetical protein